MLLLVDNYDSFTFNLYDYFVQCGADVEVLRNDQIDLGQLSIYDGIIISPGPGRPEDAGLTMKIIEVCADKLPIFGVCLGMQAIGLHYGSKLKRASFPMHGKVSNLIINEKHKMFDSVLEPFTVCRYHSLILDDLDNTALVPLAKTDKGELMALAHKSLPIWGVQFHPEAILTDSGLQLINNWLSCFNLKNTKEVSS